MSRTHSSLPTRAALFVATFATLILPAPARAQEALPFSLDHIVALVNAGTSSQGILTRARRACISFHMDDDAERRLRSAGADQALLDGLQSVCVIAPEEPANTADATEAPPLTVTRGSRAGLVASGGLAAGAAALGVLMTRTRVQCGTQPVDGACPPDAVLGTQEERPLLLPGVAAAVAIGAGGYLLFRKREVLLPPAGRGAVPGGRLRMEAFALTAGIEGARLDIVRFRW